MQGLNLHSAPADLLLRRFTFIPYARLDDLMVSLAAPGGGVGPHFDSYDVFLLQGFGRRRWRYGKQDELAIKPGLPVRILRRFTPSFDEVLVPGDMLYLPPQYAHDGVAVDPCTTYSIGFRAAPINDLACAFVDFLRDELALPGRYADPDLKPTREPARIGAPMVDRCARASSTGSPGTGRRWPASSAAGCPSPSRRCSSTRRTRCRAVRPSPRRLPATASPSTGARSSSTTRRTSSSTAPR